MKREISRQISEEKKYSNTNFHKNPSSGTRIVSRRRTDIHDEAHFPEFYERAYKWTKPW